MIKIFIHLFFNLYKCRFYLLVLVIRGKYEFCIFDAPAISNLTLRQGTSLNRMIFLGIFDSLY
jgi:hypothetical protein